jgi:hypothetical protein
MDYQNGKIYTIRSYQTDKYYIGSTATTLPKRLYKHRRDKRHYDKTGSGANITSFKILEYDDAYIELLETFPCNSKAELEAREGYHQRLYLDQLVNKKIAGGLTEEETKQYMKKYNYNRKEEMKQYREDHKEEAKRYMKEYNSEPYICECGSKFRKADISRHKRSLKHKQFIESSNTI